MEPISVGRQRTEVLVNEYVRSVYNWMGIGLAITGFIAYAVSNNEALIRLVFGNSMILIVLILAELGLVFAISGMVISDRYSSSPTTKTICGLSPSPAHTVNNNPNKISITIPYFSINISFHTKNINHRGHRVALNLKEFRESSLCSPWLYFTTGGWQYFLTV